MTDFCADPGILPENATNFQRLQWMAAKQKYVLCRIDSAQRVLVDLSTEIGRSGFPDTSPVIRNIASVMRDIKAEFMLESRSAIKKQAAKTNIVDFLADANDPEKEPRFHPGHD